MANFLLFKHTPGFANFWRRAFGASLAVASLRIFDSALQGSSLLKRAEKSRKRQGFPLQTGSRPPVRAAVGGDGRLRGRDAVARRLPRFPGRHHAPKIPAVLPAHTRCMSGLKTPCAFGAFAAPAPQVLQFLRVKRENPCEIADYPFPTHPWAGSGNLRRGLSGQAKRFGILAWPHPVSLVRREGRFCSGAFSSGKDRYSGKFACLRQTRDFMRPIAAGSASPAKGYILRCARRTCI